MSVDPLTCPVVAQYDTDGSPVTCRNYSEGPGIRCGYHNYMHLGGVGRDWSIIDNLDRVLAQVAARVWDRERPRYQAGLADGGVLIREDDAQMAYAKAAAAMARAAQMRDDMLKRVSRSEELETISSRLKKLWLEQERDYARQNWLRKWFNKGVIEEGRKIIRRSDRLVNDREKELGPP